MEYMYSESIKMDLSFLNNPTFWLILSGVMLFGYSLFSGLIKKVPVLGSMNRKTLVMIGIGGFLVTSGILGGIMGSAGTGSLAEQGFVISDLQVTTTFTSDGGASPVENANVDDLIDVRLTDAQANETAGIEEIYSGVITVTREGSLEPMSCAVRTVMPADFADEAGDDGRRYNILEKTTTGDWESYISDGAAATINSPKDHGTLTFADGASTQTIGFALEIDEEGHDALNQYSYKDVVYDICGKPFTFRLHRMD
jgi:hypothetical protein